MKIKHMFFLYKTEFSKRYAKIFVNLLQSMSARLKKALLHYGGPEDSFTSQM